MKTYKQNYFNPNFKLKFVGTEVIPDYYFEYFPKLSWLQKCILLHCDYSKVQNGIIFCQRKNFQGNVLRYIRSGLLCPKSTAPLSLLKEYLADNSYANFK